MSFISKVISWIFSVLAVFVAETSFQKFLAVSLVWAAYAILIDHNK